MWDLVPAGGRPIEPPRARAGRISGPTGPSKLPSDGVSRKQRPVRAVVALTPVPGLAVEGERSDHELVQDARGGDKQAFEALVRRYSERAFRAAYRILRDPSASEEIMQEAFIKAYKGLRAFESRSSFYTWLYRIVVNLALDRRRRDARAPSVEWEDSVASRIDPRATGPASFNPELDSRRRQVRELVVEGVQGLPEGQREVLLLREVDGLSYEEIAKAMDISKGTVMSRLHYARKKMVLFLEGQGVKPGDVT